MRVDTPDLNIAWLGIVVVREFEAATETPVGWCIDTRLPTAPVGASLLLYKRP